MNPARVVVADPLRIFRTGVRNLLTRDGEFEVVEAASLDDVVSVAELVRPDLVLVDVELPPEGAVGAVRELACRCEAVIVVWGFGASEDSVLDALRAGAHGYLRKEMSADGLVRALRSALRGEAPLARDLVSTLIGALHGVDQRASALERTADLSAREREVLEQVARGAHTRQIAAALAISEFTVKRHVQNILRKLGLPSRAAAATLYRTAFGTEEAPLSTAGGT